MRPGASLRRACRQFRFNRNLQRLFLLRCQVRSLVFVVKSHQPNLTIGRKVIVDNPQSALCRVARPPTATFVVRWEQLHPQFGLSEVGHPPLSFAPLGLASFPTCTHGLRHGLHAYAASRLKDCALRLKKLRLRLRTHRVRCSDFFRPLVRDVCNTQHAQVSEFG